MRCWQQPGLSPLCLPPVSGPPLPSPAQTHEAFPEEAATYLAAIPGHPHPQLPLCLSPFRGTQSLSEPQLRALRGEHIPVASPQLRNLILELQDQGSSPARASLTVYSPGSSSKATCPFMLQDRHWAGTDFWGEWGGVGWGACTASLADIQLESPESVLGEKIRFGLGVLLRLVL